ncbi:hypothetical protein [Paludisphaera soli]|uniref:hypothetical protein n=1 Tax=Paludisphaera soli TaxID=2712865 RepID=UPI0013EAF164|nr:hypothetical protein [Paludisphaera soli]
MKRSTILFGRPGEVWFNDTGRVRFQFRCNWLKTCGACAQYDSAVGPIWPIPIHRNCRCWQVAIAPGTAAEPFTDFLQIARELPPVQLKALVGASNWTLIDRGLVAWTDVVTNSRVRRFREVVARARFNREVLVKAGIRGSAIEQAMASVDAPASRIAAAHRRSLVRAIEEAGVPRGLAVSSASARLAERIVIGPRPGAPAAAPAPDPVTPGDLPAVAAVIEAVRDRKPLPAVASGILALGRALSATFALELIRRRWDESRRRPEREDDR